MHTVFLLVIVCECLLTSVGLQESLKGKGIFNTFRWARILGESSVDHDISE